MKWMVLVLGSVIGSFLNVVIYRLPRGLGFVKGRSSCPKCKVKIKWFDNVPLISFLILKGHCRFCGKPISWRYPLIELITAILFCLIYLSHLGFLNYLLVCGLVVVFFIDLEHQIIPDEIVIPFSVLFLIFRFNNLLSALGSFLFLLLLYLGTKGKGMGFGDVKLAFLMGLVLGFPKVVIAFYLVFLTGAFTGIILVLLGRAKFKQKIAFGPFLVFGTIISLLWGEKIVRLAEKVLL